MPNIADYRDTITNTLAPFTPHLIYLFGSQVMGQCHPESDIDIAILGAEPYNAYNLFMTAQKLADILRYEIDLIDLSTASIVMRAEIISKGKLLYQIDETLKQEFEMYTLSLYDQANLDRREVLHNYGVTLDDR